jgi:hypothetical protein
MSSLRRHEGYFLVDNRNSDGVPEQLLQPLGIPPAAGRGLFEAPIVMCSHCQKGVLLNPLRTRARPYCAKCDHYICDGCAAIMARTLECRPYKALVDKLQEEAARTEQREGKLIVVTS